MPNACRPSTPAVAALCTPGRTEVLLTYPTRFSEPIFFEGAEQSGFDELAWAEEPEPGIWASRLVLRPC